jgi:hypothetical protein
VVMAALAGVSLAIDETAGTDMLRAAWLGPDWDARYRGGMVDAIVENPASSWAGQLWTLGAAGVRRAS